MFEYEKLNNLDVLIYCGGKCGSSTLHTTFKNNGYNSYKIHDNSYFKYLVWIIVLENIWFGNTVPTRGRHLWPSSRQWFWQIFGLENWVKNYLVW